MNLRQAAANAATGLSIITLWFVTGCSPDAAASSTELITTIPPEQTSSVTTSYKDATYEINGRPIKLTNGISEIEAAPGSASKFVTKYFGNEATGDFNGDGLPDVAFLITQSTGGSGTFFYSVVAIKTSSGYTGTNAVLLGDRIAPQTTGFRNGEIIVNYADRKPGEAMTDRPSAGVSKYLKVVNGKLEVVQR